jgi:hypothetical protein
LQVNHRCPGKKQQSRKEKILSLRQLPISARAAFKSVTVSIDVPVNPSLPLAIEPTGFSARLQGKFRTMDHRQQTRFLNEQA